MKVSEPDFTFRMFYIQEVMLRIEEQDELQLQSAHAGPNKETLDHVDLDLCVQAVVASFGPFVKYWKHCHQSLDHLSVLATMHLLCL